MKKHETKNEGLAEAIEKAGSMRKLALALGISAQAVAMWWRVPANRVLDVERATGVSRYRLRPDVFGDAP